jgi:predicted permease
MERFWKDVRFGLRTFRRAPTFTAAAVVSLGLGIGLNSTIFTLVNTLFLNPLPVERPSELVAVFTTDVRNTGPFGNVLQVSFPNYKDFRDSNSVFTDLAAYSFPTPVSLSTGGESSDQVFVEMVTGNYFHTLGVQPAAGRFFGPAEDRVPGESPVIVLSYNVWKRKLGGSPDIVNKTVRVNGFPFTVVGVAADGFRGVNSLLGPDGWTPMMEYQSVLPLQFRSWMDERRALLFSVAGRLKPGVTIDQATSNLATIAKSLERTYPQPNEGRSVSLRPLAEATIFPGVRDVLLTGGIVLMVIVGLVLLIACSNVANLLLARAASRRQEIAVRLALGASRARLLRQLMTESLMLSVLGGAVGLLLAMWGKDLIWSTRPPLLGFSLIDPKLDARVFLFTLAISVVTGILFGLAPALAGSRADVVTALKDQSRAAGQRRRRFGAGNLLIVGQVALSLIALVTAALFLESSRAASHVDPGFDTDHTAIMQVSPGQAGYTGDRVLQFYRDLSTRLSSARGIRHVSWSTNLPLFGGISRTVFIEGRENDKQASGLLTLFNTVDPGFFATTGIAMVSGRDFTPVDREGSAPVAIINDTMARKYWPNEDAVGKRFRYYTEREYRQVVGVVKTAKYVTLGEAPQAATYVPLAQVPNDAMVLYVRADGRPESVLGTVQREIRQMDATVPVQNVQTVRALLDQSLWAVKLGAALLGIFGLLALGLACVGLYGVMAYSVGQRTREIGLRMALGAPQSHVLSVVMRQGMTLVVVGVAIGLAVAFWISSYMSTLLFGSAHDPASFLVAAGALLLVATIASFLPARRASRVDPLIALREG